MNTNHKKESESPSTTGRLRLSPILFYFSKVRKSEREKEAEFTNTCYVDSSGP
jgi:hypothetical protein